MSGRRLAPRLTNLSTAIIMVFAGICLFIKIALLVFYVDLTPNLLQKKCKNQVFCDS